MLSSLMYTFTWAVSFRAFNYRKWLVVKSLIYIENYLPYINLILLVEAPRRPGERFIYHEF